MSSPRVQISVLCYNGEQYLAEAVESALAQTLPDIAVVVVDDGSTDGSRAVAERYADRGVRFEVNPTNLGLSRNWTHAARSADADYVAVLHQDDRVRPDFARVLVDRLEAAPEAVAAICNTQVVNASGSDMRVARFERKRRVRGGHFDQADYELLLLGNYIYGCSWMARPSMFDRWQFEHGLGWVPDWNLWLAVLAEPQRVVREPAVLSEYRLHDASLTFDERTIMRRLDEEIEVVRRALDRRQVSRRMRRRANRMIDVRAVAYAAQVAAARDWRVAGRMLRQHAHRRGALGVVRGGVGLLVLPDLWSTAAAAVTRRAGRSASSS